MKMNKRFGAITATMAMAGVLMLAGCGGTGGEAGAGSAGDTSSSEYALVNDGVLTVGTSAEYEPFEYMEDGEYRGFDLELASALADKLGLDVQIENADFDGLVAAVATGTTYDISIAAITNTPERSEQVDFTDSYYMDDQAIVTMADNAEITGDNYAEQLDQEGFKIAVQSGSTAESFARENFPKATLVPFKNATDCFAALQSGQASALVTNRSVAAQMVASAYPNTHIIKQIPTGEEYAIAVSKDNPQLTAALNDALAELTEDGTVDNLMAKYNIK